MSSMEVPRDLIRCPVHNMPDCSPLLNGCSIPNKLAAAWEAGRATLEPLVKDIAEHGFRADTNPTIGGIIKHAGDAAGWYSYLDMVDKHLRERAQAHL